MSWYQIKLSEEQIGESNLLKIKSGFEDVIPQTIEKVEEAVLLIQPKADGGVVLHFSPVSVPFCKDLLESYSGAPTERPDLELVKVLVAFGNFLRLF